MKIIHYVANFIGNFINNKPGYKLLQMNKCRYTIGFVYAKFKTLEVKSLYIQFSTKNPWLIPHYNPHFGENDIPLFGWLFFYIGIKTEALLCPIDQYDLSVLKTRPIEDKDGNLYYIPTYDKNIISQHKWCLRHGIIPNARYNRFANTVTYYN